MPTRCRKPSKSVKRPRLSNLTHGERLIIARRRNGLTQDELRAKLGLTRRQYQLLEHGSPKGGWPEALESNQKLAALLRTVEDLEPHEMCHVARLRLGMTIPEVGQKIGYTKHWIIEMEYGRQRPDPLVDHWLKTLG
jgi:DNA-binding XRE family transcriptional regulator